MPIPIPGGHPRAEGRHPDMEGRNLDSLPPPALHINCRCAGNQKKNQALDRVMGGLAAEYARKNSAYANQVRQDFEDSLTAFRLFESAPVPVRVPPKLRLTAGLRKEFQSTYNSEANRIDRVGRVLRDQAFPHKTYEVDLAGVPRELFEVTHDRGTGNEFGHGCVFTNPDDRPFVVW